MRILVIGSAGFIGAHVCAEYTRRKFNVLGVDFHPTPGIRSVVVSNFSYELQSVLGDFVPDVCVYCGGSANVHLSVTNPHEDFVLNVERVSATLDGLRKVNPACKFINISSAAVYGNPKKLPVREDTEIQPVSPYGWHKFQSENVCLEYFKRYGIATCSLRPFSIYGPGQRKLLFWDIYQKSKAGSEINFFGTGKESRDFIFIDDFLEALDCVINKGDLSGSSYNVAYGLETSISEAAGIFLEILGFKGKITFTSQNRDGDPANWHADIGKLKQLGFSPHTKLYDGLVKYNTWLKENA